MTSTRSFGSSGRENHDASGFYDRFDKPVESKTKLSELPPPMRLNAPMLFCADARSMPSVPDGTVALVVTSPPYYAGKDYEAEPASDGSPASWQEYLNLLTQVFAECRRVLEPGGRMAVNVANLGRKPFRSLSGEVVGILQRLGFLIRGEHIWIKAESQSGSTAFGSWMSPSNPVMRDLTERIVIASHSQFGRVGSVKARREMGRPWQATITKEQFMAWTYDTWRIRPESAHRVGHPAPFPVELPERLIRLHTYAGEVVLDPFCGAGATGVAAVRTARGFIGYDLNNRYLERTRERLAVESQPEVG